jgi:hypothetical protein
MSRPCSEIADCGSRRQDVFVTAPHTLPALAGQLGDRLAASGDVWTRAAWCREGENTWHLRLLEIVDGERPSDAEVREWAYPAVSFSGRLKQSPKPELTPLGSATKAREGSAMANLALVRVGSQGRVASHDECIYQPLPGGYRGGI